MTAGMAPTAVKAPIAAFEAPPASAASAPTLSMVIPVRDGGEPFARCLDALAASRLRPTETIVVDDASGDDSAERARAMGARVVRLERGAGPAAARNRGARAARGELLFFLDADCAIAPDALERTVARFAAEPGLDALFGSYDDRPAAPGLVSQFRNLYHHWTHQRGNPRARTFWAGCGAIRRARFLALGGFDEHRYRRPSIEDIELGYRLSDAGGSIALDRQVQARHLKRWTLADMVATDVARRGAPWTELLVERRGGAGDLNTGTRQRAVVAAGVVGATAWLAAPWWPWALAVSAAAIVATAVAERDLYALLRRRLGLAGAAGAVPLHLLYCCSCAAALVAGLARAARRARRAASIVRPRV